MASISQLTARLIDLFGSPSTANPNKLMNNLGVSSNGNVIVGAATSTDDGSTKLQVTGNQVLAGTFTINGANASYRMTNYKTSSSLRWSVGVDSSNESGSNAGSSWFMNRYDDTGTYIDTPLTVSRKTGVTTSNDGITVVGYTGDGYGQFRAVSGNYGAFIRNDGTTCYLLSTASGSPYGTFNSLRPFAWNLSTGAVTIAGDGTSTTFGGVAVGTQIQGTGTVGLVSGATASGTSAIAINYAGQMATWNGSNGWNTFYNIIHSGGGTMNGSLSMNNQSTINLYGTNGYYGILRGDSSGLVGFINQANTAWNLQIQDSGIVLARAAIQSGAGFQCQAGNGGARGGNIFNFYWSGGALQAWVDTTNIGNVSVSSDERLKYNIKPSDNHLERLMQLKPISYRYKEQGIFKDLREIEGFTAQNVMEVIPSGVHGEPDAVQENGDPQPLTLDPLPIMSVTVGAVQELVEQVKALQAEVQALKAQLGKQ